MHCIFETNINKCTKKRNYKKKVICNALLTGKQVNTKEKKNMNIWQ